MGTQPHRAFSLEARLVVRLMRRPKKHGVILAHPSSASHETASQHFLRIQLYSAVRRHMSSCADLEFGRNFRKRVEAAGAVLAERLNVLHGDAYDPSEIANTARTLALEVLANA